MASREPFGGTEAFATASIQFRDRLHSQLAVRVEELLIEMRSTLIARPARGRRAETIVTYDSEEPRIATNRSFRPD